MSDILSAIAGELGPDALGQIGSSVGATPEQTRSAVAAALPALLAGLAKNASEPSGAQALASALDRDHTPNLMDSLGPLAGALLGGGASPSGGGGLGGLLGALARGAAPQGAPAALNGAGILGHVLGDQQGVVAQKVAQASGLAPETVARLLPILAPILMSALGSLKASRGLDAGGLAGMLQKEHATIAGSAPPAAGPAGIDLARIGGALLQSGVLGKLFR